MYHNLSSAVNELYQAFERPMPREVWGCPCCTDAAEMHALLAQPLQMLSVDVLERYARKAITTMGSADDLPYFWPRLAELAVARELATEIEIVFGKPALAGWRARWSARERAAVEGLAHAIVHQMAEEELEANEVDEWICAIGQFGTDVTEYLDPLLASTTVAATNLRGLYEYNATSLRQGELLNPFWEERPGAARLVEWFNRPEVRAAVDRAYVLTGGSIDPDF